jgi:uncharacterized protein (TIGR02147 family)
MNLVSEALKTEFEGRCRKNPKYSLRAFAKFLALDAPTLSKILNDKKRPGKKLAQRLVDKIALSPSHQRDVLKDYVDLSTLEPSPQSNFRVLKDDEFQTISNWYYYAILECLELKDFEAKPEWISKRLGISLNETKIALERLQRLGLLEKVGNTWQDQTGGKTTTLSQQLTSSARQEHQRQILQKAIESLETVGPDQRDQTSMTCAVSLDDLPKAKDLIKEFRRKLSKFVNEAEKKDEVYHLSISFYPVTKDSKNKGE